MISIHLSSRAQFLLNSHPSSGKWYWELFSKLPFLFPLKFPPPWNKQKIYKLLYPNSYFLFKLLQPNMVQRVRMPWIWNWGIQLICILATSTSSYHNYFFHLVIENLMSLAHGIKEKRKSMMHKKWKGERKREEDVEIIEKRERCIWKIRKVHCRCVVRGLVFKTSIFWK